MHKMPFIALLLLLTAIAVTNSCGRKGPEAPPDLLPPTIVSTSPYYDETNVPLNAVVTVTFNEAMDGNSINNKTVSLLTGTGAVIGRASCSGPKAVFKPEANMDPYITYRVSISTGVKDASGNAMAAPFVFSFATGSALAAEWFTVTSSAGAHGTISPATAQQVSSHATPTFTIAADAGYHLVTPVGGTCTGSLSGGIFTTSPVTADCTVIAAFAVDGGAVTHTVTASAGPNGSINPSGAVSVSNGATRSFTLTAASGYHAVTPVGGTCGGSLSGSTYTTNAVNSDCTVVANFTQDAVVNHTVTASAGANGTISPSGKVTVAHGATRAFAIAPNTGYSLVTPVGGTCGGSLSGSTYTTNPVNSDCTVTASFAANAPTTHTITAAAGDHGSISPSGRITVDHGSTKTFKITPTKGYVTVTPVGGTCGGSLSGTTYTTNPVNADCTVSPSFARIQSTVTPQAGPNGTISPTLPQLVYYEERTSFTVTPAEAYRIASVTGCSGSLAGSLYTTGLITADCKVFASFSAGTFTVTPSAGPNGTIVPGTPQQAGYNTFLVFTVTPDASYRVASVSGCGGSLSGTSYTTGPVTADCAVAAAFAAGTVIVTPAAGANGQLAPDDAQQVNYNGTVRFTVTPAAGYAVGSVSGCGGTLAGNIYTTAPVTADCTVTATFIQSIAI